MTEQEKEFDKIFEDRGGIVKIENFPEELKVIFKDILYIGTYIYDYVKTTYKNLPIIYSNFIDNESLNACVTKTETGYYLGLNRGTYMLILDMFSKMLATKNILPEVGNNNLETSEKLLLGAIIQPPGIAFDISNLTLTAPNDEIRKNVAMSYTTMAMEFLFYHEFCHIIRGHVDLRYSLLKKDWVEFEANQIIKMDALLAQTLEMDADSFATNWTFIKSLNYLRNLEKLDPVARLIFDNPKTFFEHWLFVMYSVFRLFGFNEINQTNNLKASHPSPILRLIMIIDNYATILHTKNFDARLITKDIVKIIESAEYAFSMITYHDYNPKLFFSAHANSEKYKWEIIYNWNNAYPLLKPFSYGELPPLRTKEEVRL